ncbi:LPS assembly protein LptD [Sphingomonas sp. MMS24-JH45]
MSDRTFLRRYDISREDRLRTNIALERVDRDSYLSIAGWAVQTMRVGERQGLQPVALPEIDYRRRRSVLAGGTLNLQLETAYRWRARRQDAHGPSQRAGGVRG